MHAQKQFPTLTTNRLVLRQLTLYDAQQISALHSDDLVNFYLNRPKSKSLDEARAFIEKRNEAFDQSPFLLYWAVTYKTDDVLIGTACMFNFSEDKLTAEIGYELSPAFQGKGIMQEALVMVIEYAFNHLHLAKLEAVVHAGNYPSIKLLDTQGFKYEYDLADEADRPNLPRHLIYSLVKDAKH